MRRGIAASIGDLRSRALVPESDSRRSDWAPQPQLIKGFSSHRGGVRLMLTDPDQAAVDPGRVVELTRGGRRPKNFG